ncbi:protein tyrosine phosphatase [Archaeoglobus sulfaticallidus PM70-1]|uniref:Protein tyrosine phosphatase n=1 Tax=Archaeoglobus sulfaticallidus PM70-1 TaxID=387631 RepID=N0BNN8_9EURY|nr:arsenate reductase ArsC [Archaeoglobus sulfaticallidus]AGK61940.1 protein tyrosine phosphatase [Archaeoglobus sulfaticallidus PM70-1]
MRRMKKKVLFLCTENSARSQMAEGLLRALYGDRFEVYSAGIKPKTVNPNAVKVMREIGIDISSQKSKSVEEFRGMKFDLVVTVCDDAKENCPFFPGKKIVHKSFTDPAKSNNLDAFRKVRDEIRKWIIEYFGGRIR